MDKIFSQISNGKMMRISIFRLLSFVAHCPFRLRNITITFITLRGLGEKLQNVVGSETTTLKQINALNFVSLLTKIKM